MEREEGELVGAPLRPCACALFLCRRRGLLSCREVMASDFCVIVFENCLETDVGNCAPDMINPYDYVK